MLAGVCIFSAQFESFNGAEDVVCLLAGVCMLSAQFESFNGAGNVLCWLVFASFLPSSSPLMAQETLCVGWCLRLFCLQLESFFPDSFFG